jgi:hypothetical protein
MRHPFETTKFDVSVKVPVAADPFGAFRGHRFLMTAPRLLGFP